jgi:hypothetical protein
MSFLDNLENSLKALEGTESAGLEDASLRDKRRNDARAAAPWAEKLRDSDWAKSMMSQAMTAGHQRRVRIGLFWIGTSLRLEALGQRLDIRPTGTGIEAVFLTGNDERKRIKVDLAGDPAKLLSQWLQLVDAQKKHDDAEAARVYEELKDEIAD